MLAYRYRAQTGLALSEEPQPAWDGKGAFARVEACAICGTDLRTYRSGSGRIDDGRTIGHEIVARIERIQDGLEGFRPGDRVGMAPAIGCGSCPSCQKGRTNMCDRLETMGFQYDGGFAEYVIIPEKAFRMGNVYALPREGDCAALALSEPLACAINAQAFLRIEEGDTVVIFGSGIIGCMHAELALASGASRVFMAEPSPARMAQAGALLPGVAFLDSANGDPAAELGRLTGGVGADAAIIACSVGQAQRDGLRCLAKHGRISLFGGLQGESSGFLDSNLIHYRELSVFGVHASTPAQNRQAADFIQSGRFRAGRYVTGYRLRDIGDAFRDAAAGAVMKAVVLMGTAH